MQKLSPPISDEGTIHKRAFMNKLRLKVQARVLLIHNVDVSDKLTNGTLGEVLGFHRSAGGRIIAIIVHFYNDKVGLARIQKTPQLQEAKDQC